MRRIEEIGRLFFSFRGRISREMWWSLNGVFILTFYVFVIPCIFLPYVFGALFGVYFVWAGLALNIKRLHDRNLPGWHLLGYLLLGLIPIVGIVFLFVLLGGRRGDSGGNRYGPAPPQNWSLWIF